MHVWNEVDFSTLGLRRWLNAAYQYILIPGHLGPDKLGPWQTRPLTNSDPSKLGPNPNIVHLFQGAGLFVLHVLNLFFPIFHSLCACVVNMCMRSEYETISLSDDFMGHRQTVHSHSRSSIIWSLIRAFLLKKNE